MSRQPDKETSIQDWTRSDDYFNSFLIPEDPNLDATTKNNEQRGLPDIAVSAAQGKFLQLLARSIGAKRVLEVGTLGGYSTIWLAQALPEGGEVVTLELDSLHAKVATENFHNAGLSSKIKLITGHAIDSLAALDPSLPFDLAFIDADKPLNLDYFTQAKRLVRPGGVIVVDNVVRRGRVSDLEEVDESLEGVRRLVRAIKADQEVDTAVIQTVGAKGYDGFLYAFRK